MDTVEMVRLAVPAASVVVAVVGLFARRGDFVEYGLKRAKNKLLRRATEQAKKVESASVFIDVGLNLQSRAERRAAEAFELEGRASVRGDQCWVAIDKTPAAFRHTIAARGKW